MPNFLLSRGFTPLRQTPISAGALIDKTQPNTRVVEQVPSRWTLVLPWV